MQDRIGKAARDHYTVSALRTEAFLVPFCPRRDSSECKSTHLEAGGEGALAPLSAKGVVPFILLLQADAELIR